MPVEVKCPQCGKSFQVYPVRLKKKKRVCCSMQCAIEFRSRPAEERFWEKVNKTDSCWLWTGARTSYKRRYGKFAIGDKPILAHRFSWQIFHGAVPDNMQVCHNCPGGDNPLCCNPDHLWLGTNKQNMEDAAKKGQMVRGEKMKTAILTEALVREARRLRAEQCISYNSIGRRFGKSHRAIRKAVIMETWKHVA